MVNYWNSKLDFLKSIRNGWCNTDYIEFLIQKVWKISTRVSVVDFGCGFGYLGLLVLPLLPKGSTYTGIDNSDILLEEARNCFFGSKFETHLIKADLNDYIPQEEYDIAMSQAFLRHIPNPKYMLDKMIRSVHPGGMVICMETDRQMESAGIFISGLEYDYSYQALLQEKQYKIELARGSRDYRTGIKIPKYMQELGLHDIRVRINDSVKFLNPFGDSQAYEDTYKAMINSQGWNKTYSDSEKAVLFQSLIDRGLDKHDAEIFVRNILYLNNYVQKTKGKEYVIQTSCTLISFGTK
jgi:2-polyprenyl-3-methyl-5-hydroxy-6-metoxy-1,4-benzoquinol methylase